MHRVIAVLFLMASIAIAVLALPADAATQTELQKLLTADGALGDDFGISVSVDANTAVIGAIGDDDNGSFSGSAYVFSRSGSIWIQADKLTASDGEPADQFGRSVSVSGDTAVIGAATDDDNGENSGAAYVFVHDGFGNWTEQAKLTAGDAEADDEFGFAVTIEEDTVVIGSPRDDDNGQFSGSAYVFSRSGTTWTQQAKLIASDHTEEIDFGTSVAIAGDTVVVSAQGSLLFLGSAYVFTRSGTVWTEQAKLTASDGEQEEGFGENVAVSGDTVVIGAYGDSNGNDDGNFSGSAYVYVRDGFSIWSEQAKLIASDGFQSDNFGHAVAVEGNTALISAPGDDSQRGSVYVYTRSGTTWTEQTKLLASDRAQSDVLGALFIDVAGGTVLAGALNGNNGPIETGAAYVFRLTGQSGDTDGDGIGDSIDSAPATPSEAFNDGDGTSGLITSRAGLSVTIEDAASPDGVRVQVGAGSGQVTLDACGFTETVDAESELIITCGSVKLQVIQGAAHVVLDGRVTVVSVPAGVTASVNENGDGTFLVQNLGGVGVVTVTVDGSQTTIPPGGSQSYTVTYQFQGFFSPVDNLPTLNSAKGGSAVPVKFSLSGNQGLNIFAAGHPKSQTISCSTSAPLDAVEETVNAGASSLSYNPGTDQYHYVWKTEKPWAGTCRQLILKLNDSTGYVANFKFK